MIAISVPASYSNQTFIAERLLSISPVLWREPENRFFIDVSSLHSSRSRSEVFFMNQIEEILELSSLPTASASNFTLSRLLLGLLSANDNRRILKKSEEKVFLRDYPVSRAGLSSETLSYLKLIGISRLGEVKKIPLESWKRRIKEANELYELALGKLEPRKICSRVLQRGVEQVELLFDPPLESLVFLLDRIEVGLKTILRNLERSGEQAQSIFLFLYDRQGGQLWRDELVPSAPKRNYKLFMSLLSLALEKASIPAPVASCQIEIHNKMPEVRSTDDLFLQHLKRGERFGSLVERLEAVTGEKCMKRPGLHDHYLPEEAFSWEYGRIRKSEQHQYERTCHELMETRPSIFIHPPKLLAVRSGDEEDRGFINWRGGWQAIRRSSYLHEVKAQWWKNNPALREYRRFDMDDGSSIYAFCDQQNRWWVQGVFQW